MENPGKSKKTLPKSLKFFNNLKMCMEVELRMLKTENMSVSNFEWETPENPRKRSHKKPKIVFSKRKNYFRIVDPLPRKKSYNDDFPKIHRFLGKPENRRKPSHKKSKIVFLNENIILGLLTPLSR